MSRETFELRLDEELLDLSSSRALPEVFLEAVDLDQKALDESILRLVGAADDFEGRGAAAMRPEDLENDFLAERIVRAFKRPSLLVMQGSFEATASETWSHTLEMHRRSIERSLPAVGRIELKNHSTFQWVGTGFLVGEDVLVTNRHVAVEFVRRSGDGFSWRRNHRGRVIRPRIDFREEHQQPDEEEFAIDEVLYLATSDEPDLSILRTQVPIPGVEPLALEENLDLVEFVGAVGYSWRDSRVEAHLIEAMERIFKGIFDVKRFAPGRLLPAVNGDVAHDCTTLGGNSGSAIIDLASGAVVGLHHGGYSDVNLAVPAAVIRENLDRVT